MLRLVRQSSNEPNVSNKDDACMVRYAYGGYDGRVKDAGNLVNCSLNFDSQDVSGVYVDVSSGKVVIQGWEIDIEEESVGAFHPTDAGTLYMYLYIELELITETVRFRPISSYTEVPPLPTGDDLTQVPSGTARMLLCHWDASASGISNLVMDAPIIKRLSDIEAELDDRLTRLGFREGTFQWREESATTSEKISRQGNYVIGRVEAGFVYGLSMSDEISYTIQGQDYSGIYLGSFSKDLLPKNSFNIGVAAASGYNLSSGFSAVEAINIYATEDGDCYLEQLNNPNWTITNIQIIFGYEAKPL